MSRTVRTITEEQDKPEVLLHPRVVAEQLAVSQAALAQMRYSGRGPQFLKLSGKAVRYRQSDVDSWLAAIVQTSTQR